ncbi:MAG: PQQ-binding-like beta-propeller repeat protein [Acidobacteriota bacterium]|nr:PQQ-binding-like beta-propeller repeat protein [Acidobacteriota bacterium]
MLTRRLAILAITLAAGGVARAAGPVVLPSSSLAPSGPPVRRSESGDWPKYCGTLALDGSAPGESLLKTTSAPGLELLWTRLLDGSVASSPTVSGGRVFVGDWAGREWSLDAGTGALLATANLGTTRAPECNPASLGITSAATISDGLLFVAGGDDSFYALDPESLAVVWKTRLGDNSEAGGYYGWCSPAAANGTVLQGVSSNCDNPFVPGRLVALDPTNGSEVAVASLTPPGVGGSGVWTSPAVDEAARKIFITTASADHLEDGHAFSMVRLDLGTLAIEDEWRVDQPLAAEADYDWGSSPTLFKDASGRRLVGAGQKDGSYYAFDRDHLSAGPVWKTPICRDGSSPQSGEGSLSTAAFDGRLLYMGGGAPLASPDPNLLGTVTALDPSDGHVVWTRSFGGAVIAPIATVNGLVLSTAGKLAFALDAKTGDTLWSFKTKAYCFGGIAISKGRLYFGDLGGNLYCFRVPD